MRVPTIGLVQLVSKTKGGTDFSVPPFVSMWRRDRDLKAIRPEQTLKLIYIYQKVTFGALIDLLQEMVSIDNTIAKGK